MTHQGNSAFSHANTDIPSSQITTILCEDEESLASALMLYLEGKARHFKCLKDFMESPQLKQLNPGLFIIDLCNPDDPEGHGTIELLPELRRLFPRAERVVLSGVSEVDVMRATLKAGATRFLSKELVASELPLILACLQDKLKETAELDAALLGNSETMIRFKAELLRTKLETHHDVLIEGESGAGKEICARFFSWPDKSFTAVNAAAIPAELFESEFFGNEKGAYTGAHQSRMGFVEAAQNGILFIDEVQSLIPQHQAKLLRFLETREFSRVGSTQVKTFKGRIVSATNVNLKEYSAKGLFREDLYFRLCGLRLSVPPLRNRRDDVRFLAERFLTNSLQKNPVKLKFTSEALRFLSENYDWPGNVRELKGVVEKLSVEAKMPIIDEDHVKDVLGQNVMTSQMHNLIADEAKRKHSEDDFQINWSLGFDENVSELESFLISKTLQTNSTAEAIQKLNMSRTRFYEKLKEHQIKSKKNC